MKKLLGIVAVSALVVSAFAQGTVVLNNNNQGWIQQWSSTTVNTLIHSPVGQATVELIAAPAGTAMVGSLGGYDATSGKWTPTGDLATFLTANPLWTAVGSTPTASLAGLINGGTVSINGVAAGGNAEYFLVGWTGAFASYDTALAAATLDEAASFLGMSGLATTATGGNGTPPATATPLSGTFKGITMTPIVVPEPTSFALAGLGLAALLVFRRRN